VPEIAGDDCLVAWRKAVEYLVAHDHEAFNLLVGVTNPTLLRPSWLTEFDPRSIAANHDCIRDVVNTIFPYRTQTRFATRSGFYAHYLEAHDKARHFVRNRGAWGTYFERLIAFGSDPAVNQLELVISKLAGWNRRATAALVLHPSSPTLDSPRTRGGPCWHFGELVWHPGDIIDLVVVYRNHDYFNKTLGNFIALGQLLKFICDAAGKTPGALICHSVHAYFDASRSAMLQLAKL